MTYVNSYSDHCRGNFLKPFHTMVLPMLSCAELILLGKEKSNCLAYIYFPLPLNVSFTPIRNILFQCKVL